jgi:hypothetical protein
MKVGQKSVARWISKLVTQSTSHSARKSTAAGLRELDVEQLRQVSGGTGSSSQLPKTGW